MERIEFVWLDEAEQGAAHVEIAEVNTVSLRGSRSPKSWDAASQTPPEVARLGRSRVDQLCAQDVAVEVQGGSPMRLTARNAHVTTNGASFSGARFEGRCELATGSIGSLTVDPDATVVFAAHPGGPADLDLSDLAAGAEPV